MACVLFSRPLSVGKYKCLAVEKMSLPLFRW